MLVLRGEGVLEIELGDRRGPGEGRSTISEAGEGIVVDRAPEGAVLETGGGGDIGLGSSSGDVKAHTGGRRARYPEHSTRLGRP
jgi:hypothetical protein